MFSKRGEISTLVIVGVLSIIGVATLISATTTTNRNTIATRAEYDGTSCNDNIGDSLNSSGSTTFTINCWGKLDRAYSYVLFWCPDKSKGATYCGDPSDLNSSQAQVLDRGSGAVLPSSLSKSTDKTCGCVQWDVGVGGATAQDGVAGGAIMCSDNPCGGDENSDDDSGDDSDNSGTTDPTATPTKTKLPNGTSCKDASSCQSGCCAGGYCNTATSCQVATPTSISAGCSPNQKKCPGSNVCQPIDSMCQATNTPTTTPISSGCSPNQKKCPGSNVCQPIDSMCQATPTKKTTPTPTKTTRQGTPSPTSKTSTPKPTTPPVRITQDSAATSIGTNTPTPVPTRKPTRFRTQEDKILKACPLEFTNILSSLDCYYEDGSNGLNNILDRINE